MTQFAPCPRCGGNNAAAQKFTWWGGAIGPRILSHVKCQTCGKTYNGKTGGDNTVGIVIYSVVAGIFAFALMFVVFFALWRMS
jgi:hypothetical protein